MASNQGACRPPRSQELVGLSVFTILLQQMFDFHSAKDHEEYMPSVLPIASVLVKQRSKEQHSFLRVWSLVKFPLPDI